MEATKSEIFFDIARAMEPLLKLVKDVENEWRLTIWREMDCYILEGMVETTIRKWAIEIDPCDPLESHKRLLYEVMNYFSFQGNDFDPDRIIITTEKRDDG